MVDASSLRERKKQRTRMAIQQAALELFASRGYRNTTINGIAEKADVAPRTVTVHFPTKQDLLFGADPFTLETLVERINTRAVGESTLDALRDWMATTMSALESEPELEGRFWQQRALRAHVIGAEPALRGRARADYYEYEQVIAAGVGEDLDQPDTALTPRLAAITAVTGLRELYETHEAQTLGTPPSAADLRAIVDRVIEFIRAGVTA